MAGQPGQGGAAKPAGTLRSCATKFGLFDREERRLYRRVDLKDKGEGLGILRYGGYGDTAWKQMFKRGDAVFLEPEPEVEAILDRIEQQLQTP